MKRSRLSEEQIIGILKKCQAGLGAKELCRKHGISDSTFYKWRFKYGGMEVSDARRLKAQEAENAVLKKERDIFGDNRVVDASSCSLHRDG
jgi:putative transposase